MSCPSHQSLPLLLAREMPYPHLQKRLIMSRTKEIS
jgi:hypothetical protein